MDVAAPFYAAMSVTMMCGPAFATLLTLVVIPVFYALVFRLPAPAKSAPRPPCHSVCYSGMARTIPE